MERLALSRGDALAAGLRGRPMLTTGAVLHSNGRAVPLAADRRGWRNGNLVVGCASRNGDGHALSRWRSATG